MCPGRAPRRKRRSCSRMSVEHLSPSLSLHLSRSLHPLDRPTRATQPASTNSQLTMAAQGLHTYLHQCLLHLGGLQRLSAVSKLSFVQEVQQISPIGTALRFLPTPISGALTNVVVGLLIQSVQADRIVTLTTVLCAIGSLLMAFASPSFISERGHSKIYHG